MLNQQLSTMQIERKTSLATPLMHFHHEPTHSPEFVVV
jgi:hypothetical protein